ncbi:hypothetical protein CERSUDRAFT_160952 [Gelatoporia subvermispora B]|uniref:TM7S3/TM198-like domain-containing protein n=1 Tax=Ceriporiopsis subvermispora (strain B) TaxID=914234 RepID=M2R245_CERS8|nr:hypothetical protein CERSUDRAFT_160952 [Gelatoporia subvermispora B]
MAASARLSLLLCLQTCILLALVNLTLGSPVLSSLSAHASSSLTIRDEPVAVLFPNGTIIYYDPVSGDQVPQGTATDGSGNGLSATAIIWLACSFAVGVPLALLGTKVWRLVAGSGIGLAAAMCVWASFVNSMSAGGISDILLTVLVLGAFVCGFLIGMFEVGRVVGMTFLGIIGGLAFGIRIVLFRAGLLVHVFAGNWAIIAVFGVIGLGLVIFARRASIALSSASVGTFLTGLGIDLVVNHQAGLSFGLRLLFDRNSAHYAAIVRHGWQPPTSSIIILAVSLALTPVFAFAQHKVFPKPKQRTIDEEIPYEEAPIDDQDESKRSKEVDTPSPSPITAEMKEAPKDDAKAHLPSLPKEPEAETEVAPSEDSASTKSDLQPVVETASVSGKTL